MSNKIFGIIEELKSLTLLEAAELIKAIEKVFEVDTAQANFGNAVMMQPSNAQAVVEAEEKTEFDVILSNVPAPQKIAILKVVRSLTGLGLKEAKDLVESAPKVLKESISKQDAEQIKTKLEEAGAKVEIK